jgi:hypothetical protein
MVELKHRQQRAQAPGCDAGTVQRTNISLFDGVQHAAKRVHTPLKEL